MAEKNFLDEMVSDKPDSFKEEKLIPIQREHNFKKYIGLIIALIVLIVLIIGIFFFINRPNITMEDFVGKSKTDLTNFLRQNRIDANGVVFSEEYSLDHDKDIVISQSVSANSKIRSNAKLNFTISKGPNPADPIKVPSDLKELKLAEIRAWINDNKITGARIRLENSDVIPKDSVIEISKDLSELGDYKRGDDLVIKVSRGPKDRGEIVISKAESYLEYENFAKRNNLKINKQEAFSDTIQIGGVIEVIPKPGSIIKEGETINVYISKGKALIVPNFIAMTKSEFEEFTTRHSEFNIFKKEIYSDSTNYIISQSIKEGSAIDSKELITVAVNKGKFNLKEIGNSIIGMNLYDLNKAFNLANESGYDIIAGEWHSGGVYSREYEKDQILSYRCVVHPSDTPISCDNDLPKHARILVTLSKGKIYNLELNDINEFVSKLSSMKVNFTSENKDLTLITKIIIDHPSEEKARYEINVNNQVIDNQSIDIYEGSSIILR